MIGQFLTDSQSKFLVLQWMDANSSEGNVAETFKFVDAITVIESCNNSIIMLKTKAIFFLENGNWK